MGQVQGLCACRRIGGLLTSPRLARFLPPVGADDFVCNLQNRSQYWL